MHRKRQPKFFKLSFNTTPIQSVNSLSTLYVIVLGEQIHRFQQLMDVDEGTYHNDRAEDVPSPKAARAEGIADVAAGEFPADPCADLVTPDEDADAQRQPADNKEQQAEVHRLFPVVAGRDGVDVRAHRRHDDQSVDAEGDEGQQEIFDHAAVGLELPHHNGRRLIRRGRGSGGSGRERTDTLPTVWTKSCIVAEPRSTFCAILHKFFSCVFLYGGVIFRRSCTIDKCLQFNLQAPEHQLSIRHPWRACFIIKCSPVC